MTVTSFNGSNKGSPRVLASDRSAISYCEYLRKVIYLMV